MTQKQYCALMVTQEGRIVSVIKMKYPKLLDNKACNINPKTETLEIACCDCGLVHYIQVIVINDEEVAVAFKKNKRATAQLRRYKYGDLQQERSGTYKMIRIEDET